MADVPALEVPRATGATIQVLLGPEIEGLRFYTRVFTIVPGGSIPAHQHDQIEHEQLVLEGTMSLLLDGVEHTAPAGTAVLIPAGVWHAYQNRGEGTLRFMCAVPALPYQVEWKS